MALLAIFLNGIFQISLETRSIVFSIFLNKNSSFCFFETVKNREKNIEMQISSDSTLCLCWGIHL